MGLWQVTSALCLTEDYEGKMDVGGLMQAGVGSVVDTRLVLPADYLKRERQELAAAGIYYISMPMDTASVWPMNLLDQVSSWALEDVTYGRKVCLHENVGQGNTDFLASLTMIKMGLLPKQAVDLVTASGRTPKMSDEQKYLLNAYAEIAVQRMFDHDMDRTQFYLLLQDRMDQAMKRQKTEARLYDFASRKPSASCKCGGH